MADTKNDSKDGRRGGQRDGQRDGQRKEALWKRIADHIADDAMTGAKTITSNGNRESLEESKPGSAQRGGPDIEKANARQPPDAFVRDSEE